EASARQSSGSVPIQVDRAPRSSIQPANRSRDQANPNRWAAASRGGRLAAVSESAPSGASRAFASSESPSVAARRKTLGANVGAFTAAAPWRQNGSRARAFSSASYFLPAATSRRISFAAQMGEPLARTTNARDLGQSTSAAR